MFHLSVKANITTIVEQHTVQPVVLAEAILSIPCRRRITPLWTALGKEVKNYKISLRYVFNHLIVRTSLPGLRYPYSILIAFLHSCINGFTCRIKVNPSHIAPLMERVHTIKTGFTEKSGKFLIVYIRNTLEITVGWLKESRSSISTPQSGIGNIKS